MPTWQEPWNLMVWTSRKLGFHGFNAKPRRWTQTSLFMLLQKLTRIQRDSEGESASLVFGRELKKGKNITKSSVHRVLTVYYIQKYLVELQIIYRDLEPLVVMHLDNWLYMQIAILCSLTPPSSYIYFSSKTTTIM